MPIDDPTLIAYLDGQLDDAACARLEAALQTDADASARLDRLARSADLARRSFGPVLEEPVPPRLIDAIWRAPDPRARSKTPSPAQPIGDILGRHGAGHDGHGVAHADLLRVHHRGPLAQFERDGDLLRLGSARLHFPGFPLVDRQGRCADERRLRGTALGLFQQTCQCLDIAFGAAMSVRCADVALRKA